MTSTSTKPVGDGSARGDRLRRLLRNRELQRLGEQSGLGHRRRREGQPAVVRRGRRLPRHRRLYSERGVVFGSARTACGARTARSTATDSRCICPTQPVNPLTNTWAKPTAWSVSGLFEHHFTPAFYLDLEGSVGGLNWSNQGGGCYVYGFGCGIWPVQPKGRFLRHATSWIIGADIGWMPVTNLNFDLELMYQSTNSGVVRRASSAPSTMSGERRRGGSSHRRLGRQLERLRWPLPHHPLLLIVTRSVDLHEPRGESSGAFSRPPDPSAPRRSVIQAGSREPSLDLRHLPGPSPSASTLTLARAPSTADDRPGPREKREGGSRLARAKRRFRSLASRRFVMG